MKHRRFYRLLLVKGSKVALWIGRVERRVHILKDRLNLRVSGMKYKSTPSLTSNHDEVILGSHSDSEASGVQSQVWMKIIRPTSLESNEFRRPSTKPKQ